MPAKGKGGYYEPWPVDFMLLELMPDEGLVAGVHWRGRQAKDMLAEINATLEGTGASVTIHDVQSRLRSMHVVGFVRNHPGTGGTRIWSRASAGVEHLARKEEVLGISEAEDIDQEPGDDT